MISWNIYYSRFLFINTDQSNMLISFPLVYIGLVNVRLVYFSFVTSNFLCPNFSTLVFGFYKLLSSLMSVDQLNVNSKKIKWTIERNRGTEEA